MKFIKLIFKIIAAPFVVLLTIITPMTKVRMIPAMGRMTVSERLCIMEKILPFHVEGVMPTSPAISPTLVFTVSNIPDRLLMIPSIKSSRNHSLIMSNINQNRLLSRSPPA